MEAKRKRVPLGEHPLCKSSIGGCVERPLGGLSAVSRNAYYTETDNLLVFPEASHALAFDEIRAATSSVRLSILKICNQAPFMRDSCIAFARGGRE